MVVLPCGAGKTVVGMAAMEMVRQTTLVLTTSMTSVKQWHRELLDKTTVCPEDIAEYTSRATRTTWCSSMADEARKGEVP